MPYVDEDLQKRADELGAQIAALQLEDPEAAPQAPQAPATSAPVDGLEQLRAMIAQRSPETEGPGAEERGYASQNQAPGGWRNVLAGVGAAIAESTGSHGALDRLAKQRELAQSRYQAGLETARGIDTGKRRVDPGTAEMLVLGGMSPEAANAATRDSQSVKLAQSGMGQLGARYKQMDAQAAKDEANRAAREQHDADRIAWERERQGIGIQASADRQDKALAAKKKGGGGGGPVTPEQKAAKDAALASYLASQANTTAAEAKAFVAGTPEGIAPEKLALLERFGSMYAQLPAKQQAMALLDATKREAGTPDRVDAQVAAKQRDPQKRMEIRNEIDQSGAAIAAASQAWEKMSPEGKKALAQMSGESWASGTLRDLVMSDADRVAAGKIQTLANRLIKQTSGAAVSDSEWTRIAREMGLAANNFDIFKSPDAIGSWLNTSRAAAVRNKRSAAKEFPGLWEK